MKNKLDDNSFAFPKNILSLVVFAVAAILAGCSNSDYQKMRGVWEAKVSNGEIAVIIVEDDSFIIPHTVSVPNSIDGKQKFTLDSGKTPKQFNVLKFAGNSEDLQGIYELSDKRMKVAFGEKKGSPMPSTFTEKETWLFEWKGDSANFVPVDSNYITGVKTWNYWNNLTASIRSNNTGNPLESAKTPDQAIKACNEAIKTFKQLRAEINNLGVSGVDTEVTSYVSAYLDNLNKAESVMSEMASIIEDAKDLSARRNSDETLGMSVLDLFLGKPGATIDALDAEMQQIKTRALTVQNKARIGGEESDKLGTQQLKLRSSLSGKYNREFPQFYI